MLTERKVYNVGSVQIEISPGGRQFTKADGSTGITKPGLYLRQMGRQGSTRIPVKVFDTIHDKMSSDATLKEFLDVLRQVEAIE